MDIEPTDPEFLEIARLIREEEKRALDMFRGQDFRRKVEARIEESPDRTRPRSFSWRLAVPVGAAALAFIAVGVVFLGRRSAVLNEEAGSGSFLAGLKGLPRLAELAAGPRVPGSGDGEILEAPRSIRDVLALARQNQAKENGNAPLRTEVSKVPRLNLERKMIILFKEKAIERALLLIRKKSGEV